MSASKVILWDVYGTLIAAQRGDLDGLVKREKELRSAFEKTVKNFSLDVTAATLHDLFLRVIAAERKASEGRGIQHPEVRIDEIWFKLLERSCRGEPPTLNSAREVALYFERQANPRRLQPQAFETLSECHRRGLRQGIISNAQFYTPIELSELLREESACAVCTYESIFDTELTFFSYELGVAKPNLAAFHKAADILATGGVSSAQCVFVGDSLDNDIAPSQRVGFRAVLYAPDGAPADSTVKPDVVIRNLAKLLEII